MTDNIHTDTQIIIYNVPQKNIFLCVSLALLLAGHHAKSFKDRIICLFLPFRTLHYPLYQTFMNNKKII